MAARLLAYINQTAPESPPPLSAHMDRARREVFYHLAPIIKAISRLQLKWSEAVLEEIRNKYKKYLPYDQFSGVQNHLPDDKGA